MTHSEKQEVKVFAPASVANVNCGFDVMGFALEKPGDEIIARRTDGEGVSITKVTGDGGVLPANPQKNTAGVSARALLAHLGTNVGIELEIHKKMPMGSGLGSSAASSVGAVIAVNRLLGSPLELHELLGFAAEGERVACGAAHLDNVAPSLLGGFVFIRSQQPPDVIELECPVPLYATVVHPKIEIRTEDTRKILRREVLLSKAVTQWGNVGGLVAGLLKGDYDLISRSLEDVIIEPIRSVLIPGFNEVKQAALDAGALGSGISGSGPSIFALSSSEETAQKVAEAMQIEFARLDLDNDVYISRIKREDPYIIEEQ
ncbi:homoserine kinase [Aliifodinibius sp. S!AR15-10]|uniref:homoserine kinase n=1 Tax=Aliifodinibius sp. S!AR15-10 TaxID=2950437 RepID=UPI00285E58B0|nr:homoserine kinase [Aliifodinibius sp. S!AR15-10]MDR8392164.1 homoserine kinase [Aliifodinibius sp. S!AR15-10]